MTGPNCMDENDCGNFFDQIDDLIEFPPDNEYGDDNLVESGDCNDFACILNDPLPDSDPLFFNSKCNSVSDLSAELSVPYEDIVQLEWLSTFMEDSFSGAGMTLGKENLHVDKEPSHQQFHTSSPVSVLESLSTSSSSSCSVGKIMPLDPSQRGPHCARSKRPRLPTFKPQAGIQLISPSSSFIEAPQPFATPIVSSDSENFAESQPMEKIMKPVRAEQKKKRKIKSFVPVGPMEVNRNPPAQAVRKCMHCEITKTPQWRAGPMGPKSLCNACGVRYKSGRLFPEYRPAASPTFVPLLHSNSHKKVIEMRTKGGAETTAITSTTIKSESFSNASLSY
ncbi:GATA transcription factor 8-like [Olea europaea var. sylvestris]|uniref:GATA transcription factor n=1 Tax=Olea europaea subsp. europaea TaxID=158383 RepID=A0A8S0UA10_OLEEU|nr:GATA transcription factor 8-like [Olea europaea var. sylvestris]XP_022854130.1 GATA transcription factor 8-like [Olea europaea var. sylvestris]CAA3016157.1 GATA transcription factor 8-like [Olea europaea subsp. europaea]